MSAADAEGVPVKFYEDLDGHNMPTVWHDPDGDGYTPVPVLTKLHVPPGYWDEVVRRLTTDSSDLIDRYNPCVGAARQCAADDQHAER